MPEGQLAKSQFRSILWAVNTCFSYSVMVVHDAIIIKPSVLLQTQQEQYQLYTDPQLYERFS